MLFYYSICYFPESPAPDKIQSTIQFNSRWILQLIDGISSDLPKLLKHFIGVTIFVLFTKLFVSLTASAVFPTIAALYLNGWELKTPLLKLKSPFSA